MSSEIRENLSTQNSNGCDPGDTTRSNEENGNGDVDFVEYYKSEIDVEDINLYNPGGHHPVHLGDVIKGKFEVVHKLGSGGFGIVWLCHDLHAKKWRALKIMSAGLSSDSKEDKIYEHLLQQTSVGELKRNHIVIPFEDFWIEGPNGQHYCIVLPVLGPPVSFWADQHRPPETGQMFPDVIDIFWQITKGVRLLHRLGVVHGDIKPENIVLGLQGIDDLSKDQMLNLLGEPELEEIMTVSGDPTGARAPRYVVQPPPEGCWNKFVTNSVHLIDFGAAYVFNEVPEVLGMSVANAAPEVLWTIFIPPGKHSDIWSLATTFYAIVSETLFNQNHVPFIVERFEYFLGGLPEPYRSVHLAEGRADMSPSSETSGESRQDEPQRTIDVAAWENLPLSFSLESLKRMRAVVTDETDYTDVIHARLGRERWYWPEDDDADEADEAQGSTVIEYQYPEPYVVKLKDLLRKMLHYDPSRRLTIDEVLRDPIFEDHHHIQAKIVRVKARRLIAISIMVTLILADHLLLVNPFFDLLRL
ncbi:kinase-like protein [Astrocystis sublimbata]|nr:kinase-like protein [Astrocystis sublimbata]